MSNILVLILVLVLIGAVLPHWGYSQSWGYAPSGGLGLVVLILVVFLLLRR
jgi:hypothetical protein